jgi:alpha-1,2-mannosidase, putative
MYKATVNLLIACSLVWMAACSSAGTAVEKVIPTDYVNPFIGASTSVGAAGVYHGLGKTFPGATTPYGMVQVSPNTITGGDNGSGYSDEHKTIEGFAFTQMSGVGWFGDLGNFLVMPTTGKLKKVAGKENNDSIEGYRSAYDKATEIAEAGYYSVELTDYRIKAESSATPHCGILRFTFPAHEQSRIQIDLARRVGGTSTSQYIRVVDDHTIQGWMKCTPEGGGWGNGEGKADYTVYYYAKFSKPLDNYGFWSADIPDGWTRKRDEVVSIPYLTRVSQAPVIRDKKEMEGRHLGFFTEFPTKEGEEVEVKVGISFVDMEGALNNFQQELASKSFGQVKREASDLWNKELGRIRISGGTDEEKTIFYTALYHTMIDPRIYTDTDGRYVGGDKKIYACDSTFVKRTIFSGWDVFRSQFPLQTIINPRLVSDQLNSLITMAEQSGREYYERWEFLNSYSGCMLGNPALSVLADAYMKGIRTYDVEKAYRYAVNTSRHFGNDSLGYTPEPLSISHTLEYAYTDWCISQLAKALGKEDDYKRFHEKGQAYRRIFDKEKGWFRPRRADGTWEPWPENARTKEWYGCIEANAYQQGWFVPHDVPGMVELMGGREKVIADLTDFFDKTPSDMLWNEYYNHANEPVHFVPFLFNRLDVPWHTQKWTRHTCKKAYADKVEGIVGNEDVGQMSAWYILAASGIHPSCPGSTRMEITSPVFDKVEFKLDSGYYSGKAFTVIAHDNNEKNIYIQKALLNGEEYGKCYLDFADIAAGGTLELFMGDKPNKEWGI